MMGLDLANSISEKIIIFWQCLSILKKYLHQWKGKKKNQLLYFYVAIVKGNFTDPLQ